ncbi:MAG: transcriptional repressor [Syntrophobacterales bacterium]|nr:transcriptional repressor [Syntrophobacterales bacterium]
MPGDEEQVFRDFLAQKGRRWTPERQAVLREVFAHHDHFDAEELHRRLRERGLAVSRASVYRTLGLLVESGLVAEVFVEDGHMHYEHVYGHEHHCHLRCLGCRRIIEFRDEALPQVEARLAAAHQFQVTGHKLEVYGWCAACRGKQG